MAGCYGNSPEDRYFEAMLFQYLEEQEEEEEVDYYQSLKKKTQITAECGL